MEKIILDQAKLFGFKTLPAFSKTASANNDRNPPLSVKVGGKIGGKPCAVVRHETTQGWAKVGGKIGGKKGMRPKS